jgi:hypothetical protein
MENENLTPDNGTEIEPTVSQEAPQENETPTQEQIDYKAAYEQALKDAEDYKTKFANSTRENQIIRSKETDARRELTNEPTEAELRKAFPSFDYMSDEGKELARFNFRTQRETQTILQAQRQREAEDKWNRTLEQTVIATPALEGKERAFTEFAKKPQYRGASVELLVDAFLHKNGSSETVRREPQAGLETGSGGPKTIASKPKFDAEKAKMLRETDTAAYKEYIKTHPVDID